MSPGIINPGNQAIGMSPGIINPGNQIIGMSLGSNNLGNSNVGMHPGLSGNNIQNQAGISNVPMHNHGVQDNCGQPLMVQNTNGQLTYRPVAC